MATPRLARKIGISISAVKPICYTLHSKISLDVTKTLQQQTDYTIKFASTNITVSQSITSNHEVSTD